MTNDEIDALAADFARGVDRINTSAPPPADLSSIYDAADDGHFVGRETAERRFYNWYAAYGALVKPRRILEIGVRRGYGALALIKGAGGATESYLGIDSEIDLPGQNARTAASLTEQTGCRVNVLTADTMQHFPQLIPAYDLVHVDGNHSTFGAASDLLNVAPLVRPGGVIVADDIDSDAVAQGVEIALAAFGQRVVRKDAGDVRKQALLFVRRPIPKLDFAIAAMLWRPGAEGGGSTLSFYRSFLRDAPARGLVLDAPTVTQLFAQIVQEYARRLHVPVPDTSGTVFDAFTRLAQALPGMDALIDEARPHVAYAAERLAGVGLPSAFGAHTALPDAFEPGTPAYGRMTWEIAANLAEILERRVEAVAKTTH